MHKDVRDREQTVREIGRRSEERGPGGRPDDCDEEACRRHWAAQYGTGNLAYEHFDPAYRFGAHLAGGLNRDSSDWTQLEPEARRTWEADRGGTWETVKEAVRYSWEQAKHKLSSP